MLQSAKPHLYIWYNHLVINATSVELAIKLFITTPMSHTQQQLGWGGGGGGGVARKLLCTGALHTFQWNKTAVTFLHVQAK